MSDETPKVPGFRLKFSFLSVLVLIQALLIGLSGLFTAIFVETLEHWESRKSDAVANFIESESNHGTTRVTLAVETIAANPEIARALGRHDRKGLLQLTEELWKNLQTHGLEQFEFFVPGPKGVVSLLSVDQPEENSALDAAFHPLAAECDQERKLARGLEQGRSGYAFRAVAPVLSAGRYVGCVEFGTGLNKGFLKRLNETQPGSWSIVDLAHGVVGVFNKSLEDGQAELGSVSERALGELRSGKAFREADSKTESVSLYVPLRNSSGDVALYVRHDFETNFYRNLKKTIAAAVGICVLGLLLSGFVIFMLYRAITVPIDGLVAETEKIRRFSLEDPVAVGARLKEIQKLVVAITNMKTGLSSFKKYVPAELVRQLIAANQEAKISGQRRELTMLFSDIADFTSISEALPPQELTAQLSAYLSAVTEIILAEQGTVDKYIGDAVMAFWGAPVERKGHATAACFAALRVQRRIDELNRAWAASGKPAFHTRIGINTGEVIVGNMGSEQRLNYTVIGDPVNLASRLEGTNKSYKTKIIVSEHTYEQCKQEVEARLLDFTTVKGKSEVVRIYELLGGKGELAADHEFARQFSAAVLLYRERRWDEAIEEFTRLARQRPEDHPSVMFLRRCQGFKQVPPPESWSGVAA